jgi:hypothetical protein
MSKYAPLRDYLQLQHHREFILSFGEIEDIIRDRLPASADRPQFWANVRRQDFNNVQREAWRVAGYEAFLIAGSQRVRFRKLS